MVNNTAEYEKNWAKENPDKIKAISDRYYKKNRIERIKSQYERREKFKKIIFSKLGKLCVICGKSENIHLHEIYGKDHHTKALNYVLEHIEDFTPLCDDCHHALHFILYSNPDSPIFKELLKELQKALMETKSNL